jgi:hypothetical protein
LRRILKLAKRLLFSRFKPALAERLSRPPKGEGWIHEFKFDGYPIQMHIASSDAGKVLTRAVMIEEDRDASESVTVKTPSASSHRFLMTRRWFKRRRKVKRQEIGGKPIAERCKTGAF